MRSTVLFLLLLLFYLGYCTCTIQWLAQQDEARKLARLHFKTMADAYKNYDRKLLKTLMDTKSTSIRATLLSDPELLGRVKVRSASFQENGYNGDIHGFAGNGVWEPVKLKFELEKNESSPTRFVLVNLNRCGVVMDC